MQPGAYLDACPGSRSVYGLLYLKQPPTFLEQLVLRLLVKMGYGGLETPAEHLGAPGDAGLDGLIRLDRLGLDVV